MPPLGQASRPPRYLSPLPRPSRGRPCRQPPSGSSRITARTRQRTPYQTGNFECPRARVNVEKLKANFPERRLGEVRRIHLLETVWKIAGRVGSRASRASKTSKRRLFAPWPRLMGPQNGAFPEFPDRLSTHLGE